MLYIDVDDDIPYDGIIFTVEEVRELVQLLSTCQRYIQDEYCAHRGNLGCNANCKTVLAYISRLRQEIPENQ